jgi:hypothetical protein
MPDTLNSLLVSSQVPEFVREDHPLFIAFLEAYYEFLENKQGIQKNDLLKKSKDLRNVADVDVSIDEFEEQFFNTFASLLPRDSVLDKATLIKNVLPLYLSKGSEKSFKLLFRILFGQELEVKYPRNDVLRASDGKWVVENTIRVLTDVYTPYTGDGVRREFLLAPCRCPRTSEPLPINVRVFVDGIFTEDFYIRRETKKLIFNTPPASGADIKIYYVGFDFQSILNRQLTGSQSGATILVEKFGQQIKNNKFVVDLFVDSKNLVGDFIIAEELLSNTFHENGQLIPLVLQPLSTINSINILDGGSDYVVGDPIRFTLVEAAVPPSAFISKTFSGTIDRVIINNGGAGFQAAANVNALGLEPTQLSLAIAEVNGSGIITANTFKIASDVITDIDPANTQISADEWFFPSNVSPTGVINVDSTIAHAFGNISFTSIGDISNVQVLVSVVELDRLPVLDADPAVVTIQPQTANTTSNTILKIDSFGSLGRMEIVNSGTGYNKGDEVIFKNKPMSFGTGAEAEVSQVSVTGQILRVDFVPSKITGTASITSLANVMVQGIGTLFEDELIVGDEIMINGEKKTVEVIASNTSLNVSSPFAAEFTSKPVRKFGKNLIGGFGYTQDKLPDAHVVSSTGANSKIIVTAIMGDGEDLTATGSGRPGEIEEIVILNSGETLKTLPRIDLTQQGDGTARAEVVLNDFVEQLEGRWTTSDSILSSLDRKLQGRDFYINQSYVLSSQVEFAKYKKLFKELVHPAGFRPYAEFNTLNILETDSGFDSEVVQPKNIRTLSGLVSLNSSIYVTGTGTKFVLAEQKGLISVGSFISINSETRVVDSIISNTELTVTSPFTITTNNENMVVLNTVYDAIATEITLEQIIAENELVLKVET